MAQADLVVSGDAGVGSDDELDHLEVRHGVEGGQGVPPPHPHLLLLLQLGVLLLSLGAAGVPALPVLRVRVRARVDGVGATKPRARPRHIRA